MQPPMPSDTVAPRHDAITAVPGIRLGHWTNRRWATGCTAIICEQGAVPGYFGPGGAPGTLDTDLIRAENSIMRVHGVLLTGGSLFGLEAASGIKRYLAEQGVGERLAPGLPSIPIVVGAVVFDLPIGRPNHPDRDSGYRAARNARAGGVEQGSVGVGAGCTVGKAGPRGQSTKGGFGTAAAHHDSGLIVGAAVATNSVGDIVNPADGSLVAGVRLGEQGEVTRGAAILRDKPYAAYLAEMEAAQAAMAGANTTLAVVATNARLHKGQARRISIMASAGLARAIDPAFTPADGDSIFTLATGEIDISAVPSLLTLVGVMAAEAITAATLRSVQHATTLAGVPSASDWSATRG